MAVTIKQVASRAGVSFKTVSRVINHDPKVSNQTRVRVEAVIRELGYRPNIAARQMRTRHTQIIGFITDEVATTPHSVEMIKGAQDAAWDRDIMLLIANTERDLDRERTIIDMMLSHHVEGIVYATHFHRPVAPHPSLREARTILVDCFVEDHSLPSIVPDEVSAGYEATRRLIDKGHKRIGFVNLPRGLPASEGRLAGYMQALAEHNIDFDVELVIYRDTKDGGYLPTIQLLSLADPPTAIFCANDRLAMGAYDAVKESQRRIPQDIAIMGFDNQTMIAMNLRPALTTMALPHYEMGAEAVHVLLEPLQQGDVSDASLPAHSQLIACRYVERESI